MLMLKLQYFGHPMWITDSLEKTLMLWKIEGMRRRGWQRLRSLDGITMSMDMSLSKPLGVGNGQGSLACFNPWGHKVRHDWVTELKWDQLPLLRIYSSNRKCNQVHLNVNSLKSKVCSYILIHLRESFEKWGFIFLLYVSLNMYIFMFSKNKTAWCMHIYTHICTFFMYIGKYLKSEIVP